MARFYYFWKSDSFYSKLKEWLFHARDNNRSNIVKTRKHEISNIISPYKKPQMWLLASTEPTDMNVCDEMWNSVQEILESNTNKDHLQFFMTGIEGVGLETFSE